MKFAIPEISWHNKDPVLSVDFQPKIDDKGPLRLATGGTDTHVLIWYISTEDSGSVNLEVAADLTRHQKAVNVVRWAPSGVLLASGDDDSFIFIWKQKTDKDLAPVQSNLEGEEQYKETWVIHKTLRGHMEDVLDLSWSSDSLFLASGSVDNKLLLWDVTKGKYTSILTDHKGFVQGVAWDPQGQYVATASSDRTFRTFDIASKKVVSRSSKAVLPFPPGHSLHNTKARLYHDDTLQTFFRRLQWSPDGLLLAVPAGRVEPEGKGDKPLNAVYIYTRYSLKVPCCVVPCGEPALAVRWAPLPLRARAAGPPPALPLPRRSLLAVGTRRALLLYDTQQRTPLALISNIHYTRITDLTWSGDGRTLVASSTDGFCSVVTFAPRELGEPLPGGPAATRTETDIRPEPMDIKETEAPKEKAETKSTTPKLESLIKFKAPPRARAPAAAVPDVHEELAMPSWSDNSTDIIRPREGMELDQEVTIIEDSEDIKLVYEETEEPPSPAPAPQEEVSPAPAPKEEGSPAQTAFLKQAKVTDLKTRPGPSLPSPKAPRRVNLVTLSSPKNKKK